MRKTIIIGSIILAAGLFLLASTPLRPNPTTYEQWSGTSGAADPHTLTKSAISFCVESTTTTVADTFSIKFNGASAAIVVYGGKTVCIDHSDGFVVSSFIITAVNNTPTWQAYAFEMP